MDEQNDGMENTSTQGAEQKENKSSKSKVEQAKKIKDTAKKIKNLSMKGPLLHILLWVIVIVLIIIFLVGIIMFITTMPGMVMEKLKELVREVGNGIASFFGADSTTQIEDQQIYDVMDYLETMGYDLQGYGFITKSMKESDVEDPQKQKLEAGLIRDKESGLIAKAESDYINTYLVSDNYVYTVSNFNLSTGEHWWDRITGGFIQFGNFFASLFGTTLNEGWGRGLISLWYEGPYIGSNSGKAYGDGPFGWKDITVDASKKSLSIRRGWGANRMEYSLDGWTGRYGMPLEFLLSMHIATEMPDLSYDMATSFDTDIEILLHDQVAHAQTGYKEDFDPKTEEAQAMRTDPTYILYSELNKIKGEGWSPTDGWTLSKKEAHNALMLGIQSPDTCTHTADSFKILDMTDNGDGWVFDKDNLAELKNTYKYTDSEWEEINDDYAQQDGFDSASECMVTSDNESDNYNPNTKEKAIENGYAEQNTPVVTTDKINVDKEIHDIKYSVTEGYESCNEHTIVMDYGVTQNAYCKTIGYYQVEKTKTTRYWDANVDEEDVQFIWETYCYKVYSYSNEERTQNKTYVKSYFLDFVLRDKTTQELIDNGVLNEDGSRKDDNVCSDDTEAEKACEVCRKHIKKIMNEMKDANDENFDTYQPYISKVTNHWYRDVYFAVSQWDNKQFVQNDEEYEAIMKERWTKYEKNDNGTYKLYKVDENGNLRRRICRY